MDVRNKTARTAGLLYLIIVVAGIFGLLYVPSRIAAGGDAARTASNILAYESLFRAGIVVGALGHAVYLVLPLVLYKLLNPVDRDAAALMAVFGVVSVPIYFAIAPNNLDALSVLSGHSYGLTADQAHAQVMLSLDRYGHGLLLSEVFWGLWLLPFGYLVFRSGFLPKVLGVLLMIGCFGYLIDFSGQVLFPGYAETSLGRFVRLPGSIGELGIGLWLLIVGARRPTPA